MSSHSCRPLGILHHLGAQPSTNYHCQKVLLTLRITQTTALFHPSSRWMVWTHAKVQQQQDEKGINIRRVVFT